MHDSRRAPLRWRTIAVVLAALVLVPVGSVGADDQLDDIRAQREEVRRQAAAVAGDIDVIAATDAEVSAALEALEANVRAEQARLDEAQRAVEAAEAEVVAARASEVQAQGEVDALRSSMAAAAVEAYVRPPEQDTLQVMLSGELGDAAERRALLDVRASSTADLLEQYRAAQEDLAFARQSAVDAAARAAEQRGVVEQQLGAVQSARDEQAVVVAQVQIELDAALQRARELEAAEASLDERERARQAELRAAEEARLAAIQRQLAEASARRGTVNVPSAGPINLTSVGGIVVNSQIASQLAAMLQAAAADGITLTGGGYRDSSQQIALRRAHCGSSNYAIYEMSPSSCRPPTARPGQSLHERGLAIDFVANGRSISSRSNPGFAWLAANASSYGFYNLPSEPWHWSTTGG
ncbi:MAG TPA: D-alanyl-D-alanine carboxypeptidase family protein [Acidimicrobiales bacterium]|nr:D-alanyl-D-alanine carboxypeptidase family protein [Acidimicrobiales bacterium]